VKLALLERNQQRLLAHSRERKRKQDCMEQCLIEFDAPLKSNEIWRRERERNVEFDGVKFAQREGKGGAG